MIALLITLASAAVTVSEAPILGEEVLLTVVDELGEPKQGVTLRVVHRDGLAEASEMAIGISDSLGQVPWVPAQSGNAAIIAGDETLPIHVAWTTTPAGPLSSLILLLIAGIASLGYAVRPRS